MNQNWDENSIPSQNGKRILITGATSGLGAQAAKVLLSKGAQITVAVRSPQKMAKTFSQEQLAQIKVLQVDVSLISSVQKTFENYNGEFETVICNAGIMATPFEKTTEGIEMQFATNHLGHFELIKLLNTQIKERVVTVASLAHQIGSFGNGSVSSIEKKIKGEASYTRWGYYGSTKLANLLFTLELNLRAEKYGFPYRAFSSHPGYTKTNLGYARKELNQKFIRDKFFRAADPFFGQKIEIGTLPILYAATYPDLPANSYIGPSDFFEFKGYPKIVHSNKNANNKVLANSLWIASENLINQIK